MRKLLPAARILLSGNPPNGGRPLKAANQASLWHAGQRRKGKKQEPYINHLMEVSQIVATSPEGRGDENVIIAALMHDLIEDQEITAERSPKCSAGTWRSWCLK